MFICKECQTKYKVKPDFCDCGNDTFEEVFDVKEEKNAKKTFDEMYPFISRFKNSLDPLSVIIFSTCIILSILSLIFIGNSNEEVAIVEDIKEVMQIKVKDIDEIWDDTPVKIVQEKTTQNKVNEIISKVTNPKPISQPKKIEIKAVKPKTTNKVQTASKTTTVKTKTNTSQNTKPSNSAQLKPTIQPQNTTQKINQNTTSNTPQKPSATTQNTSSTQEFKVYKNSLRNLLFSKIDFTQIEGDGIGIVSFKIDANGRLTNKTFVQRSNNEQLDDAIFYSLNTTSSFKAPPSAYSGEILKFKVKFINGQYEVSLN